MRVDGNAATVITDGDGMIGVQFHLDPCGVTGDGFVHRVVEHLCHQMVQGPLIRAADIHAGAFAHRFQPLQHFDGGGVVALLGSVFE